MLYGACVLFHFGFSLFLGTTDQYRYGFMSVLWNDVHVFVRFSSVRFIYLCFRSFFFFFCFLGSTYDYWRCFFFLFFFLLPLRCLCKFTASNPYKVELTLSQLWQLYFLFFSVHFGHTSVFVAVDQVKRSYTREEREREKKERKWIFHKIKK